MTPIDELDQTSEPLYNKSDFDLDRAVAEAREEDQKSPDGQLHISTDVIQEIARRALARVSSVVPGNAGMSVLGLGRKNPEGVRVSLEEGTQSHISVDAYVLVRYGLRIPDVAWDLQEFLKKELESSTGYEVKAVNIFVQGVYFGEQAQKEEQGAEESEAKAAVTTAGE